MVLQSAVTPIVDRQARANSFISSRKTQNLAKTTDRDSIFNAAVGIVESFNPSKVLSTTRKTLSTAGGTGQRLNVYTRKPEKVSHYTRRLEGMAPG